jgi:hypothetical protein
MIRSFTVHREILPPAQQRLWPMLRPTAALGLVLYGGTAIALRLGHRVSVDFDFFTDRSLDSSGTTCRARTKLVGCYFVKSNGILKVGGCRGEARHPPHRLWGAGDYDVFAKATDFLGFLRIHRGVAA